MVKRYVLLGMFETILYTCSLYHIDYMPKDSENYPFFKKNDDFYFLFHMNQCWPKGEKKSEKNRGKRRNLSYSQES